MGAKISIHSPRKGRDEDRRQQRIRNVIFQSTLPAKGETIQSTPSFTYGRNFNPLSPQRERPLLIVSPHFTGLFQSTLPAKGETNRFKRQQSRPKFQSTLPAKGETIIYVIQYLFKHNFNPLSPQRERRHRIAPSDSRYYFNPLSPQRERPQ